MTHPLMGRRFSWRNVSIFFFQAEDGIRDKLVTGVQTCALPIFAAPHHQHFFNFRLDLDVDGPNNSVREMNTKAAPAGATNPSLNGMIMQETTLDTEDRKSVVEGKSGDLGGRRDDKKKKK